MAQVFAPMARRLVPLLMVAGMLILVYRVMAPFVAAITWAGILAHISWPLYRRLRSRLGERSTLSALFMMLLLTLALGLPLLLLLMLVQQELMLACHAVSAFIANGSVGVPDRLLAIPWIGQYLHDWLGAQLADPNGMQQLLAQWLKSGSSQLPGLLGKISRGGAGLAVIVLTLFFCYRDGETVLQQIRLVLNNLIGNHFESYLNTASTLSRAIVLSAAVSALAQGSIAALGYRIVGVPTALLLGVITAVASIVPLFGTLVVWGSVSLWLLVSGHPWQALALFAWGSLLVNPADNLIRPLLISNAIDAPFLLVFFGVLGGMLAFGLVGVLLGPMILAVAIAVWGEWVQSVARLQQAPGPGQ
jgi:predicted PurR-regulated permease PerM